ncbi:MAG: acyl-ACP--UDP-N-acetylglucosamine O-acyltransferase [Phycisphaeraceae bacterium]
MPHIHPSSVIDDPSLLADDVRIGPGCIIQGRVGIGAGTRLLGHVFLVGPLTLGQRNTLYPNVALGFEPQDRKFDFGKAGTGTVIGDDNVLREGVTIHRATGQRATTLGNRNMLMVNSHLGHDCLVDDDCTLANGALLGGHVEVQNNVTMGGNAAVHQFCRIGRLSMLSGVIAIVQDLPPFCVAYNTRSVGSLNIIGLRRAGYRDHVKPLQKAFEIFFRQNHVRTYAVDLIRKQLGDDPLCLEFADFVATPSPRGVTGYRSTDVPEVF